VNDEHGELLELLAAHAELNRLTNELADARERRRVAAQRLVDRGRSLGWIGRQLGVSRQAVDSFLKYQDRRSDRT